MDTIYYKTELFVTTSRGHKILIFSRPSHQFIINFRNFAGRSRDCVFRKPLRLSQIKS
jgi:hypothetical protein